MQFVVVNNTSEDEISSNSSGRASNSDENSCRGGSRFGRGRGRRVCPSIRKKRNTSRPGNRHKSRIQCSFCKVHLCVAPEQHNCFLKYRTVIDFFIISKFFVKL